jgi:hypothetical protein
MYRDSYLMNKTTELICSPNQSDCQDLEVHHLVRGRELQEQPKQVIEAIWVPGRSRALEVIQNDVNNWYARLRGRVRPQCQPFGSVDDLEGWRLFR